MHEFGNHYRSDPVQVQTTTLFMIQVLHWCLSSGCFAFLSDNENLTSTARNSCNLDLLSTSCKFHINISQNIYDIISIQIWEPKHPQKYLKSH